MELSVQSKLNRYNVANKRKELITKERLHIGDKITYEAFLELYKKYGEGYSEKDFAKFFLDIESIKYYYLMSGKIKETEILEQEYISEEEIKEIRQKVIKEYNLIPQDKINYNELIKMHALYGGKLSIKIFAEEILDITPHSVDNIKSNRSAEARVLKGAGYDKTKVSSIKTQVIQNAGLHIGDEISLTQFNELYEQYGNGIDKKVFGLKVLGILPTQYNIFLRKEGRKVSVFSKHIINPEYIFRLRERIIQDENLHIDDVISNEEFKRLYKVYGGILSENTFAEEILDISSVMVKNMRVDNQKSAILTNIVIPEDYITWLREKIITENRLEQNQQISLKNLQKLYEKYGGILSQRQFASRVLDIPMNNYNALCCGNNKRTGILRDTKTTDFKKLRAQVIEENNLHRDDVISYKQFRKLHKKYAPNMEEYVFADKVLDIEIKRFHNIKFMNNEPKTYILVREKLPSKEEMEKIKQKMISEKKLHSKDTINYKRFMKLHRKYGGIMPDYMFAENMLDLTPLAFKKMKNNPNQEIQILLKTHMNEKQIQELRDIIISENSIYVGRQITLEEFKKMYNKYEHTLSEIDFAKKILGINRQNLNKLKQGLCRTLKALMGVEKGQKRKKRSAYFSDEEVKQLKEYLIEEKSLEQIATILQVSLTYLKKNQERLSAKGILTEETIRQGRRNRTKQKKNEYRKNYYQTKLKSRSIIRIIEDYLYTPENVKKVRAYINKCEQDFQKGLIKKGDLDFLEECLVFIVPNAKNIAFFGKVCVHFKQYKKAYNFIAKNINNESISVEDRQKLSQMQNSIRYAIRKNSALQMLKSGQTNAKYIAEACGILEIEVLEMKKALSKTNSDENEER